MAELQELFILKQFTDILDELDISYAVGGSIASSIYGNVRFTEDVDISVENFSENAEKFYEKTKEDFYLSRDAMQIALHQRTSFNIIHLQTAFKIDIFISKNTDFDKRILQRCRKLELAESLNKKFCVVSPEDIIILKLRWYTQGGCISERQLSDCLGVLQIQADNLDMNYLKSCSIDLNVNDLLEKLLAEFE